MDIIYLGNGFPPLNIKPPSDIKGKLLVFETTIDGYRAAVRWMKNNPDETVYRLVVPYSTSHKDVGDYFSAPKNNSDLILSKYDQFPSGHIFSTVEKCSYEDSSIVEWPFPSSSRLVDFTSAVQHFTDEVTLRDPISGLSCIQDFFLEKAHTNIPLEEQFAIATARFRVPLTVIKTHYERLSVGNRPPLTNSKIMDTWPVPNAVVNGPYPLSIETVRAGIIQSLDFGTVTNWDAIPPFSDKHTFTNNGISQCECNAAKDTIVKLPYGITAEEFVAANTLCDMRTSHNRCCFDKEYSTKLLASTAAWDPVFKDATFRTLTDYMMWWIEETLTLYKLKRAELAEEASTERLRRRFLKELYDDKETRVGPFQKLIRKFKDEKPEEKRARIESEYEGHQEFLDLPVSAIDQHEIIIKDYMTVPTSSKDMWIDILHKL